MKKRTAFIFAFVSLMPIAQPLLIASGAALTLSFPEVANANRRAYFYFNRAYKKAEKGDDVGAIADYTKVIELDSEYVNAYINRGLAKSNLEDFSWAIADYNKAIELDPEDALAYYNRGIAKGNLDDMRGACADWKKSASLGDTAAAEFVKMDCK